MTIRMCVLAVVIATAGTPAFAQNPTFTQTNPTTGGPVFVWNPAADLPTIDIKVRTGTAPFVSATTATFSVSSAASLDIQCIAKNKIDGMASVTLAFDALVGGCTFGDVPWTGTATVSPLPASASKNSPSGQKPATLTTTVKLKGPLACTMFGQSGKGRPYGQALYVSCTGKSKSTDNNWNHAEATLRIQLQ
jgi:hypothetical protein